MAGLYIHIPFCRQACFYCNFHFSTSDTYTDRMVDAILIELEQRKKYLHSKELSTVYLGGGTPSILSEKQLVRIFKGVEEVFSLSGDAEITLEANPDDLDEKKLKFLKMDTPVNRLSLGVQSFFDKDLVYMNRVHNARESEQCIELSKRVGFNDLSIDLIYGVPTCSAKQWEENLRRVEEYEIPHLSSYHLTVEPNTALIHRIEKQKCARPIEEEGFKQFEFLMNWALENKYLHYEISNFARSEKKIAKHNTSYWKGVPYLGVGPSAHSYDGETRSWNIANNVKYMKGIETGGIIRESEKLSSTEKFNELLMTGLRTMWGVSALDLKRFPLGYFEEFKESASIYLKSGHIRTDQNRYILTTSGKHLGDRIISDLMVVGEEVG